MSVITKHSNNAISQDDSSSEGHQARVGFLLISGAKVWFLVCATIVNIGLPRLFGDPASFGDYGVVNSFISIITMVLIAGVLQAVSKRISEQPDSAATVFKQAMRLEVRDLDLVPAAEQRRRRVDRAARAEDRWVAAVGAAWRGEQRAGLPAV